MEKQEVAPRDQHDDPGVAGAERLRLGIEGMAYGGKGIARLELPGSEPGAGGGGKVFFVKDAIEGDIVEARVTSDEGRYGEAEITALLQPSPHRGPAPCPVAGTCGGCQWQGVTYERQLAWKRSFIESALRRIGGMTEDFAGLEVLPSPAQLHYRNRILVRAHLNTDRDGGLQLGYFQRGSRVLVPISACAIAAPVLNTCLERLGAEDWSSWAPLTARLELQEIPQTQEVVITVYPAEGQRADHAAFAARLGQLPGVAWAGLVFDLRNAPPVVFDRQFGRDFSTRPGQFQQVNLALNHVLRGLVRDYAEAVGARRLLDVFCGSGNLSLPLADGQRYVEGVEANQMAIAMAKHNAAGIANVTYLVGDAEKHLWKCSRAGERFDLVILDPPRQGLYKGMVPLKNLAPDHILYVSCDPTTLARDLGYLLRKKTYELVQVKGLDFFPHTYHVETVAILRRRG